MPHIHQSTFRVRYYECDAYGHLNNVSYLRYMQESAFDASAAVGYDVARYVDMGHHWLVRESEIDYLRPVRYGDSVRVKTWVADARPTRSRRAYEFYLNDSDDLIARATTDWAFVNTATGRPAAVPPSLIAAFFPDGDAPPALPRDRFPSPPAPPKKLFEMTRRVTWQDIDTAWHVNNAMYLAYAEDCGVKIAAAFGTPMEHIFDTGFAIVARSHRIEYREPAQLDDELTISTWLFDPKRASVTRHYNIARTADKGILARVQTNWVWVDSKTGRPIRIPEEFLKAFGDNIALSHETAAQP